MTAQFKVHETLAYLPQLGRLAGLDPSMTRTGLATARGHWSFITRSGFGDFIDRGMWMGEQVAQRLEGIDLIVMERPIVYGRGKQAELHQCLGTMRGVIRRLHPDIPTLLVSPSTAKKYATGNGRASKEEMVLACRKIGVMARNDDEADAYWFAAWGAAEGAALMSGG